MLLNILEDSSILIDVQEGHKMIVKAKGGGYYVYESTGVLGKRRRISPRLATRKQAEGVERRAKRKRSKKSKRK